ncbi:MAG: hypothetical protein HZB28_09205 [Methylocystis sp.]|nr:hypothetical protein [Methylocystis sp.]
MFWLKIERPDAVETASDADGCKVTTLTDKTADGFAGVTGAARGDKVLPASVSTGKATTTQLI